MVRLRAWPLVMCWILLLRATWESEARPMARFAAKETLESLAVARSFESAATSNTGLTAVQCEAHIRGHRVIAAHGR